MYVYVVTNTVLSHIGRNISECYYKYSLATEMIASQLSLVANDVF